VEKRERKRGGQRETAQWGGGGWQRERCHSLYCTVYPMYILECVGVGSVEPNCTVCILFYIVRLYFFSTL
jgi:hypothetical protein